MNTNRRQFITTLGLSAMAVSAGIPAWAMGKAGQLEKIGFISGIVDNFIKEDWKGTLEKLAKQGYTEMESGNYMGDSPAEFKKVCQSLGINPFAGGSSMAGMLKDTDKQIAEALEAGKQYWVCYWPWQTDAKNITADEAKQAADNLNKLGQACKKAGIKFCWHNHNWEFEKPTSEGLPFDILMKNTDPQNVKQELDIYWVRKGGGDPIKCLKDYPGRFEILHVKDMDNTPEKSFACPGSGIIDFKPIFREAWDQGVRHYIVEKDGEKNGIECLKSSAQYLKNVRF
ncbi:MAG TPA: sugar phosphate isomerase/epimerase [Prolixibacteraceae bacterium]|nr:sugar phosphate isomerase/epimerase [Prolixibacteraceae bacterium]